MHMKIVKIEEMQLYACKDKQDNFYPLSKGKRANSYKIETFSFFFFKFRSHYSFKF